MRKIREGDLVILRSDVYTSSSLRVIRKNSIVLFVAEDSYDSTMKKMTIIADGQLESFFTGAKPEYWFIRLCRPDDTL